MSENAEVVLREDDVVLREDDVVLREDYVVLREEDAVEKPSYLDNFQNMLSSANKRLTSMTKNYAPAIPYIKDKYLTPNQLKLSVFNSPRVQKIIDELSLSDSETRKQVSLTVENIITEIALGQSIPIIRYLGIIINKIVVRVLTGGLLVNEVNLKLIKSQFGGQPVLYLPSHRSYADFILMSYVCFCHDIVIPGIAAGMDFHGMAGFGTILRKTGAFYMRRTFATDMTYWYIFKEYMRSLMKIYHAGVEFFIEGTRSRSNKALTPKIGLLSMALEPLFMGEIPDVLIVPISVTYEKPLEEQLFVYELLGVPKPKESTWGFIKALNAINKNFGTIYFEFGKPFSAKEYFGDELNRWDHSINPAHVQNLKKSELGMISRLASDVVHLQQEKIFITTFNLISIFYNHEKYLGKILPLNNLIKGLKLLIEIFKDLDAVLCIEKQGNLQDDAVIKSDILKSIDIHNNILQLSSTDEIEIVKTNFDFSNVDKTKLKGHNLSAEIMKLSVPVFNLQLYNNPCLHWLAQPALLILAAKNLLHSGLKVVSLADLKRDVLVLRHIFALEFVLCQQREETEFQSALTHLIKFGVFHKIGEDTLQLNSDNDKINIYLSAIAPFVCCYMQTASTLLSDFAGKSFTEKEGLAKTQENVEQLLSKFQNNVHPYCLSLDSIGLAFNTFLNLQCLSKSKEDKTYIYSCSEADMNKITKDLLVYCSLLPFNYLTIQTYVTPAKL